MLNTPLFKVFEANAKKAKRKKKRREKTKNGTIFNFTCTNRNEIPRYLFSLVK